MSGSVNNHKTVLLELLPKGAYDTAHSTLVAKDVTGHAKALEQVQADAELLLFAASEIPPELLSEYERDYALPRACSFVPAQDQAARIAAIQAASTPQQHYTTQGVIDLFDSFGVTVLDIQRYRPLQCTAPCTAALDTARSRFKLTIRLQAPVMADLDCLLDHYLPNAWRVDFIEV